MDASRFKCYCSGLRSARLSSRCAHEAAHCKVGKKYANGKVGVHLQRARRICLCVKSDSRLPCSHSHCEGDQGEEHSCHLQPHDTRKSHKGSYKRALRLLPGGLDCLNVGNPRWCCRGSRCRWCWRRDRRSRPLVGRGIRCACGVHRLRQRLGGMASPVS